MTRKLASIQEVLSVEAIPNSDRLECLTILGWRVVAKKGDYKPGDLVVYCEIDSLLPERPEFEFLRASSYKPALMDGGATIQPAGFRIRTAKLRGCISQGIVFPLSILPDDFFSDLGDDASAALGIVKYEPPVPKCMSDSVKGPFPTFLTKTDETRIQTVPGLLERWKGQEFIATEKLDGTSFTTFVKDGEFGVCSRNLLLDETSDSHVLCRLAKRLDLEAKMRAVCNKYECNLAIQGEAIGPGIQGNKYNLSEVDLYVFNVIESGWGRYRSNGEMHDNVVRDLGLKKVPQVGRFVMNHTVEDLVQMSVGHSELNKSVHREGIVVRPVINFTDEGIDGPLSFKVINPQFLLWNDE
jgi:RNA ligase (TIGR02306 family)